jgi:hypothetical protein
MKSTIDYEVPDSDEALVSVGIYLVAILLLVCYKLMKLTALELHLLFIVLVLNAVRASAIGIDAVTLGLSSLLIIHLIKILGNTLSTVPSSGKIIEIVWVDAPILLF